MSKNEPQGLYGNTGTGGDFRVYEQLKELNKSAKIMRQWVTWIGVMLTLWFLGTVITFMLAFGAAAY